MSYDLLFWRQSKGCQQPADEIAADLLAGMEVDDVLPLPVVSILAALRDEFPGRQCDAAIRSKYGTIDVNACEQYVNFMCYGDVEDLHDRIVSVMSRFDCPLYDPQLNKRYGMNDRTPDVTLSINRFGSGWSSEPSTAPHEPRAPKRSSAPPVAEALGPATDPLTGEFFDLVRTVGPFVVGQDGIYGGASKSLRGWSLEWDEKWHLELSTDVNSIEVCGEDIYVTTGDGISASRGSIDRVDPCAGEVRWSRSIRSPAHQMPPRVAGELVFVCNEKKIHAFETAKGKPRWDRACAHARTAPIIWTELQIVVVGDQSAVVALDVASGNERWSRDWKNVNAQRIGDDLWVFTHGERLYRLNPESGETLQALPVTACSSLLFDDETLYCETYHHDDEAYLLGAVDRSAGTLRWEVEVPRMPGNVRLSPDLQFIHDGCIVVRTFYGPTYALRQSDGAMQWKIEIDRVRTIDASVDRLGPTVCTPHGSWLITGGKRYKLQL